MDLIIYLLKLNVHNFLRWNFNKRVIIFSIIYVFSTILNLFVIIRIIQSDTLIDQRDNFFRYLSILLFILTIVRKFIPTYIPLSKRILTYHPRSSIFRYLINLFDEFASFYFINAVFFIVLLVIFTTDFSVLHGIKFLIIIVGAVILRRLLQSTIEQKIKFGSIIIVSFVSFSIILFVLIGLFIFNPLIKIVDFILLTLLLINGFFYEEILSFYNSKSKKTFKIKRLIPSILINTSVARASLMVGLLLKFLFLTLITFVYYRNGNYHSLHFVIFLFISPALIFTYTFNNTWGFYSNFWFTLDQSPKRPSKIFWIQTNLICYPLIIDFLITCTFFFFNKSFAFKGLIFYVAAIPILVILSFYWSMLFPVKVLKGFNINLTTSTIATFATILIIVSLMSIHLSNWFFVILPFYFFVAFVLYINLDRFYYSKRIRIYNQLFK